MNIGQPSCGPKLGKGDVFSLEAALAGHADLLSVHALTLLVQRWSVSPPWTLELEWPKATTKSSALALLDHVPWKEWEPPSSPIELFIYADGSVMRNSHGAAFVVFRARGSLGLPRLLAFQGSGASSTGSCWDPLYFHGIACTFPRNALGFTPSQRQPGASFVRRGF